MKTTVSLNAFLEAFKNLRPDKFSREALVQLFNYLDGLDPQMELYVIDLCCRYEETSISEAIDQWDIPIVPDEDWDEDLDYDLIDEHRREQVEKYLKKKTTIVGFTDDSVIYAEY